MELSTAHFGLIGGGGSAGLLLLCVFILKCCGLPGWGESLLRGNLISRNTQPATHILDTPSTVPHQKRKGKITADIIRRRDSIVPHASLPVELNEIPVELKEIV